MNANIIDLQMAHEKATSLLELAKQYNFPPEAVAQQDAHCKKLERQLDECHAIIDREAIDLLLWAKRHPEAAKALVDDKAAVVPLGVGLDNTTQRIRLDGDPV